jgi:hypothetical protein
MDNREFSSEHLVFQEFCTETEEKKRLLYILEF